MAEFNIDRIRFRWKNIWAISTVYRKDDIVIYQGKSYVCLVGHTSQAVATGFYTDLNHATPKWELMLDGMMWRGDWVNNTYYSVGEIIKWEGYVYRCIEAHTSNVVTSQGPHTDYSKWTIVATTDNWTNTWTTGFFYDLGDIVIYNGITYRCIAKHTSASNVTDGLEQDQISWEIVTRSDNWRADWTVNTRYMVDDVVRYNGIVYRCTVYHTSNAGESGGLEADLPKWTTVLDQFEYKVEWTTGTRYRKNDLVKYGETIWKCLVGHTASALFRTDEASSYWSVWLPGFGYELLWNQATEYQKGDIVLYGGYVYTCLQNNLGSVPSVNGKLQDTGDWELTKEGYKHQGEYNHVTQYYTGDVVRNGGYLYICVTNSISEYPDSSAKWQILVPGHKWKSDWVDNVQYYIGDIVTYDGSAYYCIARHAGTESDNRPDLDMANEHENYWQLMLAGIDGNVLTTDGDIRVRDASQTTRLAIGAPGATLKAVSNNTIWQDYGPVSKVYYVGVTGVDSANSGTTVNAPFRTIKYACDYINADWANRAPATVFVTAGYYDELTPISIPKETTLVGDELRSVTVQPAAGREANNMFYVSNGAGMRNMTLQGLTGTLGTVNAYGTKRPNAGAYVSLDPGTGISDTNTHITSKSPYIQNITTFGTGCVGLKIDGALHNSGYKSIVANDFTQIISDGIGYWATNNGRSELVSVFTYYCHIGYLADEGGKLRATNGNNSYGTFGSVAEGYDATETAITGNVDNQASEASANVITDNQNMILALEYKNAGRTYKNKASGSNASTVTFAGQGVNATATYEETRDGAVSEVRLLDPGDSSAAGGNNYQYKLNNAQGGDATSITLAAADTDGSPSKYNGMRIFINSGVGVGQYGYISSYNDVSKVAQVSRESDGSAGWDHINPGWPIETLLGTNTRYSIEPRVTFSDHPLTATQITAPSSTIWKEVIWFDAGSCFVAVTAGGAGDTYTSHSADGITWSTPAVRFTGKDVVAVQYDSWGSQVLIFAEDNGGSGGGGKIYQFGVAAKSHATSLPSYGAGMAGVELKDGAIIPGDTNQRTGFAFGNYRVWYSGNNFGSYTYHTPTNASNDSALYSYTKVAYGPGVGGPDGTFVYLNTGSKGGVAINTTRFSSGFSTQYDAGATGRLPVGYTDVIFGNGRFVAIDPGDVSTETKTAISFDGIYWYEYSIPGSTDFTRIFYSEGHKGQLGLVDGKSSGGTFMAIGTGNQLAKSQDGVVWRITSDDSSDYLATESASWSGAGYSTALNNWVVIADNNANWNLVTGWGAKPFARAVVKSDKINEFFVYEPGSDYASAPTVTVYDPQATINSVQVARINDGVLPQPVFGNRGTSYITASCTIAGFGHADSFQIGGTLKLKGVSLVPGPGDNLVISGINDVDYKVSSIDAQSGSSGNYNLTLTISPTLGRAESPEHNTAITIRQQYSQVRLTGHDFLDVGSGNIGDTDYPNRYVEGYNATNDPQQQNEVREANAGRVFYTSTDQDGNFRVGEQFKVEQDTGIITLNASYFTLTGLTQLTLGGIVVGGTQVIINEFSKEPTFIANANTIVPTQRAIGKYLQSRVSGGSSNANTNKLVSGSISVTADTMSTTSNMIHLTARGHHDKPTKGSIAAMQYFTHGADSGNDRTNI